MLQPPTTTISSSRTIAPIVPPIGRYLQETLLEFGEIDVEHHDDEQEQNRHRADIDDDEDHRQELRAEQQEQPRRVEEGEDQEQHRMHRVARRDDHEARGDDHGRKEIEEQRRDAHCVSPSAASAALQSRCILVSRMVLSAPAPGRAWVKATLIDRARRARGCGRSPAPSDRRSRAVGSCRNRVLRASRPRTRRSALRRWRRPGRPPGRSRNRCI